MDKGILALGDGFRCTVTLMALLLITACGGDSSDSVSGTVKGGGNDQSDAALDATLLQLANERGLTGDPATPRNAQQVVPTDDPLVKLGKILFFSQTLSGGYDSSCGTCHHPDFGGSDGLSLSVGVVPEDPSVLGPGRRVDHDRDADPLADGGPNMHRNSQSIFNVGLFDRTLLHDGRVFVNEEELHPGGMGQAITTPDTANIAEASDGTGLLEAMMPFPLVNPNEMRGFLYSGIASTEDYRQHLVRRLRGEEDRNQMWPDPDQAATNWLTHFREAFGDDEAEAAEIVTLENIQKALATYIRSMTFVETPWKHYLADLEAAVQENRSPQRPLDELTREGARLFYTAIDDGGLGCYQCHAGDRFTDEQFHNVGFPQIGRGFRRADREDRGRWGVTKQEEQWYAFRTPSLLNVAERGPWGHAGTFSSLRQTLRYHVDPVRQVDVFDWSLGHLSQFDSNGELLYPMAEELTRQAIEHGTFQQSAPKLPGPVSEQRLSALVAFLEALSDECVTDSICIHQWAPDRSDDPDGNLLVRNETPPNDPPLEPPEPTDNYPDYFALDIPEAYSPRDTFPELSETCDLNTQAANASDSLFIRRDQALLPNDPHGFFFWTWTAEGTLTGVEATMIAGGVTAAYLDDDCWPDLLYAGGDYSGMTAYRNLGGQSGFARANDLFEENAGGLFTGSAYADITGDYRREVLLGNLQGGHLPIYYLDDTDGLQYRLATELDMARHTYGISFGFPDPNNGIAFYLGHWGTLGVSSEVAPALWQVNEQGQLEPRDREMGTSSSNVDHSWNFTPLFADLNLNGYQDLLVTSDFGTSSVLRNIPHPGIGASGRYFDNVTDRNIIDDENGMGAALGDFENRGVLDWFVSSIDDPSGYAAANWGVTGNRLYRNVSGQSGLRFSDRTEASGTRDGNWGWGACAADFNNNGFLDIFHVNGFGYIPMDILPEEYSHATEFYYDLTGEEFQNRPPRLFINQGDGTFIEKSEDWGLDVPSEGRGVACFDYDRDGDIDIVLLDHSRGLQFFENQTGHGAGSRFLNIRVVGESPNTDALGARVYVTADVGGEHGTQTMMRVSQANSNFNGQNLPDLHFGLGHAEQAEQVRVVWPNGEELTCTDVASNQFLVIDEREDQSACP